MNKFEQEAANRKAAEKEARNKARDEALEFVNNYKKENGNKGFISLRIRDGFIGKKLKNGRLQLERNKLWDFVYVANMCKADFLGSSIPNEQLLAKYVKDVIDDPDAEDGFIFNRFYADTVFMNNPIDWEEML